MKLQILPLTNALKFQLTDYMVAGWNLMNWNGLSNSLKSANISPAKFVK